MEENKDNGTEEQQVIKLDESMFETECMGIDNRKNRAKELLEEKYGEEFIVTKYLGSPFMTGYFEVEAYPRCNPELLFKAAVDVDGKEVEDQYVSKSICYNTADLIEQNLNGLRGSYFISIIPIAKNTILSNPQASMEDFVKANDKNRFSVYFFYCPDEQVDKETYASVCEMFKGLECMSGNIPMYVVEEKLLNQVEDYAGENRAFFNDFKLMTKPFHKGYIPFENGKVTMSEAEFLEMAGE